MTTNGLKFYTINVETYKNNLNIVHKNCTLKIPSFTFSFRFKNHETAPMQRGPHLLANTLQVMMVNR